MKIQSVEAKFNAEIAHQFMVRHPEYIPCEQNSRLFELWFTITKQDWTITNLERAYKDFQEFMLKKRGKLVFASWKPKVEEAPAGAWTFGIWTNQHAGIALAISFGVASFIWRYKEKV